MTKLFLHIGTHKTGSTAIQDLLYRSRDALAREGILYPETGLQGQAHHNIAWATGVRERSASSEFLSSAFGDIARQAGRTGQTVVVSSEEFEFTPDVTALSVLNKHFDVRVVVYLRKQDHCLEAAYNEHVRNFDLRFTGSIYQFALRHNFFRRYEYANLLRPWADVFGRENVLVRPYGTHLVEGDACADFLSLLGVPEPVYSEAISVGRRINRSLPAHAIPYLARINTMSLDKRQQQSAQAILRKLMKTDRNYRFLRSEESAGFYANFRQCNEAVFADYLQLANDPFMASDSGYEDEHWVDHEDIDTEVLLALAEAIFQQAGRARLRKLLQN